MRLTTFILTLSFLLLTVGSYSQKASLTLAMKDAPVSSLFQEIEEQTGFRFLYRNETVENKIVTVEGQNLPVETVLKQALGKAEIDYAILENNLIVITPTKEKILAQQIAITGTVTSGSDDEPLPGVNVIEKGTQNGTVTSIDGKFTLSVSDPDAILVFSFIGYLTEEVQVTGKTTVNVVLIEDIQKLDQVIVIGYGTTTKKDLPGSVASIKAETMSKTVVSSFEQGLQGKLAGVQVTQGDAAPGAGINILIRGTNSYNSSSQPLYVVDGIPLGSASANESDLGSSEGNYNSLTTTNVLATIAPSDIQSIDIQKDAYATAMYGSRGANGVVIITTKKGTFGKNQLNFGYSSGWSKTIKQIEVLNAREFTEYQNEAAKNAGTPLPWDALTMTPEQVETEFGEGIDWQDEILQTGRINNYQLGFTGNTEIGGIAILGNYLDQKGTVMGSSFKRGGLRLNLDNIKLKKWLETSANIGLTQSSSDIIKSSGSALDWDGAILRALTYRPFVPDPNSPRSSDVQFDVNQGNVDPVTYINSTDDVEKYTRVIAGANISIELPLGIKLENRLGGTYILRNNEQYYNRTVREGYGLDGLGILSKSEFRNLIWESLLRYNRKIGNVHSVNAVLGYTIEDNVSQWITNEARNFPDDKFGIQSLQNALVQLAPRTDIQEYRLLSYLGRIEYIFKEKYIFSVVGRRDGASKFAKNKKYAFFPGGAIAWRIIEEPFMKNQEIFNELKIRTSYGTSGNQAISPYQSLAKLSYGRTAFDNNLVNTAFIPQSGGLNNDNLSWETTTTLDIGIDGAIFKDRMRFTLDYYNKRTTKLLQLVPLQFNTGYQNITTNVGEISNKGFEIQVEGAILTGNFRWSTSINFSTNKNKILDMGPLDEQYAARLGANPAVQPFILRVGEPIGAIYGYVEDGIFQNTTDSLNYVRTQSNAKVGQIRYKDLDTNGIINNLDQKILGYANPKFIAGWTNTFTYKNFDLTIFINTVQGNNIINVTKYTLNYLDGSRNIPKEVYDNAWRGEGISSNEYPEARGGPNNFRFSDRFVEDGSFIRLKNLEIGYNFKSTKVKWIQSARIYASAINLFTITNYSGFDPEVSTFSDDPTRQGVDFGSYPQSRTYTAGLSLTF